MYIILLGMKLSHVVLLHGKLSAPTFSFVLTVCTFSVIIGSIVVLFQAKEEEGPSKLQEESPGQDDEVKKQLYLRK